MDAKRLLLIAGAAGAIGMGLWYFLRGGDGGDGGDSESAILTVSPPQGQGTTEPPVGDHEYPLGSTVWVTAFPSPGWYFEQWGRLSYHGVDALYVYSNPGRVGVFGERNIFAVFKEISDATGVVHRPQIEEVDTGVRHATLPVSLPTGTRVMGMVSGSIYTDAPAWTYLSVWLVAPDGTPRGTQTFHGELSPGDDWEIGAVTSSVVVDISGVWKLGAELKMFDGAVLDTHEWNAISVT